MSDVSPRMDLRTRADPNQPSPRSKVIHAFLEELCASSLGGSVGSAFRIHSLGFKL